MEKELRYPPLLTCTGQSYDGVDDLFDHFMSSSTDQYKRVLQVDYKRLKRTVMLNPGDPLYHICWLGNVTLGILRQKPLDERFLKTCLSYILKWLNLQCDKLLNEAQEEKDQSEFHLSQTLFIKDPAKDDCLFTLAIENLISIMTEMAEYLPKHPLLESYIIHIGILEKCLSHAFECDPVISKKKHKNSYMTCLGVMKFDTWFSRLNYLINNEQYINAEAYANKCLRNLLKIHTTERPLFIQKIAIMQAYIASKLDDIDMCLDNINIILKAVSSKKCKLILEEFPNFSSACAYAGAYFEKNNEIDKAIKYYVKALKYAGNSGDRTLLSDKLKTLAGPLLLQIEKLIKGEFDNIISQIKTYPKQNTFIIYFNTSVFADEFRKILIKNKINHSQLAECKTPEDKNAVAFVIDYKFKYDASFKALKIISDFQKKDYRRRLREAEKAKSPKAAEKPQQSTHSRDPQEIGASLSHPKVSTKKVKKKPKPAEVAVISVSKWGFLSERRPKPLEKVEFLKSTKVFDPDQTNGVVTLRVNGYSGRWFACINPQIVEEIEKIKKGEGVKLKARFEAEREVSNDLCVPCYKEMKLKSAELGLKLPYVFKIRLLGCDGIGNVRVYAKVVDQTADGKKLVEFCAINPNSHVKHSRPVEFEDTKEEDQKMLKLMH